MVNNKISTKKTTNSTLTGIRGSVLKLNEVCALIRDKSVDESFLLLKFCNRRVSNLVLDCLKSAVANAENNFNMNSSNLYISSVLVGKNKSLRRHMPRGRGKSASYSKFYSMLSIFVSEFDN